jgi:hypothetical protein
MASKVSVEEGIMGRHVNIELGSHSETEHAYEKENARPTTSQDEATRWRASAMSLFCAQRTPSGTGTGIRAGDGET